MGRLRAPEDRGRRLGQRERVDVGLSLAVFVSLYTVLGLVDFVLMRRYARFDPPAVGGAGDEEERRAGARVTEMTPRDPLVLPARVLLDGLLRARGLRLRRRHAAPVLGRSESDRKTMFATIGPVWDGNEVWLVIAGAATFAAFPVWYATMFSGFYLALLLSSPSSSSASCRSSGAARRSRRAGRPSGHG